jgi:hypothetical protein
MVAEIMAGLPGAGPAHVGLPGQQRQGPRLQHTVLLLRRHDRIPQQSLSVMPFLTRRDAGLPSRRARLMRSRFGR